MQFDERWSQMIGKYVAVSLALTAVIATGASFSSAQPQGAAPVAIKSCTLRSTGPGLGAGAEAGGANATLWVNYTNNSQNEIKQVVFHVVLASGFSADVADVGSFAPGVTVNHQLFSTGIVSQPPQVSDCTLKSVEFSNDTMWEAGGS